MVTQPVCVACVGRVGSRHLAPYARVGARPHQ
jgi:hypothetical protein